MDPLNNPERPVRFYHRRLQRVMEEAVYGERWLRWVYGTVPGRCGLRLLVRRPLFSKFYGWLMDRPSSRRRILPFIRQYGIDTSEFAEEPESFRTFNQFFHRRLKPECRPVAGGENVAVFPADGRHWICPELSPETDFLVKGQRFDLAAFLGDGALAEQYLGGVLVMSRLCPVDYHRYHFPCAGVPDENRWINGWLYSVNPIALWRNVRYLWENKRSYCLLESPVFGKVVYAEIGATCVGGLERTYRPGKPVEKGEEKGYFRFGGSCVILIFAKNKLKPDEDLIHQSALGMETHALMGERLGVARGPAGG